MGIWFNMMNIVRFYYEQKRTSAVIGHFRNDAHSAWGKL